MNGKPLNNNDATRVPSWVIAEAPARVDVSGGWSDTPPITYENGGAVTNIAVKVDGVRPIGAKIRKIQEFHLLLVLGAGGSTENSQTLTCKTLNDLKDYSHPSAPGALLKTAFLCTKIVTFDSSKSLSEQLKENYGCGFELHTWSHLPQGSGMGTSSILAGTICAAIWNITQRHYDNQELLHLVVELEQMLTTGGGWQDQVGGLIPGVKFTTSPPEKPIKVLPKVLDISDETRMKVATNMALIYTGKTRLAKDVLQNVIQRWRTGDPEIVQNVKDLTTNAKSCAEAWSEGDLEKIGLCLNTYRKQKNIMAPGSEPGDICEIINNIRPLIHGCCLAGAGGGGYLFVITKEAHMHKQLEEILSTKHKKNNLYTIHRLELDTEGLTVNVTDSANKS